ncbi:MAG: glycosyltransferase family 4 protein [Fuerstiella sp.]|nr:glycosyltransferase family 4 protein [Fuerstiella sp.]
MNTAIHPSSSSNTQPAAESPAPRVAYMMSRFPKITETFILYEMQAAEKAGVCVEVFPLRREQTEKMHPEAVAYVKRAHFLPLLSCEILCDNLSACLKRPRLWLRTLGTLIRANLGCRRFLFGALAVFPMCVSIAQRMRQANIDHIHAHFASHPAAAAWIIHQFSGIPYSFVAHGSDLHRDQHMLTEKVRDAQFVVAISKYNRKIVLTEAGHQHGDKVKVIHCGVNPDDFEGGQRSQRNSDATAPLKVFCIGTLHEVKGQTYLIEATQQAKAAGVAMSVHLVGDGPDLQLLQQQTAAAGLTDNVVFEGRRDRHEIIRMLQTADILVAPSVPTADGRREGIPVVLMEAMAAGVPVIASRLSGIPELVEHETSGLLTEPGDTTAIADAIQLLSRDPQLRQHLGETGRRTVQNGFNLETGVNLVIQSICGSTRINNRELRPAPDTRTREMRT